MTTTTSYLAFLMQKGAMEQKGYEEKTGQPWYTTKPGKKNGLTVQQLTFTNYQQVTYQEAA